MQKGLLTEEEKQNQNNNNNNNNNNVVIKNVIKTTITMNIIKTIQVQIIILKWIIIALNILK